MACKLKFNGQRLPFIWNVSSKVGDSGSCANTFTDVELVSFLLDFTFSKRATSTAGLSRLNIDGRFDVSTAYCIYNFQVSRVEQIALCKNSKVDGIISPARLFDPAKWTIAHLNEILYNADKTGFMELDKNMRLSPQLRLELSKG